MFDTVEIPSKSRTGRHPLPNPFLEAFPSDDKALTFIVKEGRDSLEARRAIRQIRTAAHAHDRTARILAEDVKDGFKITTWTTARQVRKTGKK